MKELPKIDFILISHDHYDHLDMKTVKFFNKNKNIIFIVPLGVGSHLTKWGVPNSRIIEMDWWDSKIIKGVKFICTPAQHFSGRKGFIETQKSLCSFQCKHDTVRNHTCLCTLWTAKLHKLLVQCIQL